MSVLKDQEFLILHRGKNLWFRGSVANKQSPRERIYKWKGDLFGIFQKFKVSIEDIVLWNDLKIEKPLQINQAIKIFHAMRELDRMYL